MKPVKQLATTAFLAFSLSACSTISQFTTSGKEPAPAPAKYETYVTSGQQMPVTKLTTINGKSIDLTQSDKRKLVILFATWCSDSQRAMTALQSSPLLADKNVEIIAIARENTIEEVTKFKDEYQLDIQFVADVDRSIYKQFASAGIPRFVMLNEKNTVIDFVLAEGENQLQLIHWNDLKAD